MRIDEIEMAGMQMLDLLVQYHNPPEKELLLDAILLAYLTGKGENIARQHKVRVYGTQKAKRIDFRCGGSNPVVLEFAVRGAKGGGKLYGSQNISELRKLCRVSQTTARLRALLLLDLHKKPINKQALKNTYDPLHAGRGKFKRSSVRVIYVHDAVQYNFLWDPFRSA